MPLRFVPGLVACSLGLAAPLAFSTAALAQSMTPMGTIEASIGGESNTWETLAFANTGTASVLTMPGYVALTIQGHIGRQITRDVLSVEVAYMGAAAADSTPFETSVSFFPTGLSGAWWSSEDAPQPAQVTFDRLDLSATPARAEGSFVAQVCRKASMTAPTDAGDCQAVSGRFATDLAVSE